MWRNGLTRREGAVAQVGLEKGERDRENSIRRVANDLGRIGRKMTWGNIIRPFKMDTEMTLFTNGARGEVIYKGKGRLGAWFGVKKTKVKREQFGGVYCS